MEERHCFTLLIRSQLLPILKEIQLKYKKIHSIPTPKARKIKVSQNEQSTPKQDMGSTSGEDDGKDDESEPEVVMLS